MKRIEICLSALLAFNTFVFAEEALPLGSAGQVTMNWQKFDEMWSKMQGLEKTVEEFRHPENLPPVPFTITKAAYQGVVKTKKVEMTGLFDIDVFEAKKWVKIPFLPSSMAITLARLDGNPVGIVQEGGFHNLVIKNPGRHILHIQFSLKAPEQEQAPQLQLNVVETPLTLLSMEFGRPKLDIAIEPSQGVETETSGTRTRITAAIPPTSTISLHWQKALADEATEPAKLYVESENLLTLTEGTARGHWNLNYTILHRGIREIRVLVPEAWNILSVACDGIQEWKPIETPQGPAIVVQLAYAKKGNLQVSIEAEKAIGEKEEVLEVPRVKPLGVEREQGTIGIEAKGALELQVQESSGLNAIDPQELPGSLWLVATQPILFAFRYTKPYALSVSMKRHPEVAVLTTTVDDANAVTLMTERGQMVTRIDYQVRNHLKQYLSLRLPPNAQLWSAFVAGVPVKPTQVENGHSYRIPLAKSQIENGGQQGFPVEIVYYMPVPKFGVVGYRTTSFPIPDAPVSRVFWSLYLPERYRFLHFGGDMEKGSLARALSSLSGQAVLDERPKSMPVDAVRSKEGRFHADLKKMVSSMAAGVGGEESDAPAKRQARLESEMLSGNVQQMVAGVFPIAFNVPTSGQLFHFGQVMVVGSEPQVTMTYVHLYVMKTVYFLILGFLLALAWLKRSHWTPFLRTLAHGLRSFETSYLKRNAGVSL